MMLWGTSIRCQKREVLPWYAVVSEDRCQHETKKNKQTKVTTICKENCDVLFYNIRQYFLLFTKKSQAHKVLFVCLFFFFGFSLFSKAKTLQCFIVRNI